MYPGIEVKEIERFIHVAILTYPKCQWRIGRDLLQVKPLGKEGEYVVMDNGLARASWSLTLDEHKLARIMIGKIDQNNVGYRTYRLRPNELSAPRLSTRRIRDLCERLMRKPIVIERVGVKPKEQGFIIAHLLTVIKYLPEEGYVEFKFSPDIWPYLVTLVRGFIGYDPTPMLEYKSRYSIRLEEILRSYQGMRRVVLSLSELRRMLDVGNKYRAFRNLKQRVLEPAALELKRSLPFKYTPVRVGKAVRRVIFSVLS